MRVHARGSVLAFTMCFSTALFAQQVPDRAFRPLVESPTYAFGSGPVILVDEAHSNGHTSTGGYFPFAELLRRDGYVVRGSPGLASAKTIRGASVFVTANAREPFGVNEVAVLRDWVKAGAAILLIVDHGDSGIEATRSLANAFGIRLGNGSARTSPGSGGRGGRLVFRRSDGTLVDHAIIRGIDSVATIGGTLVEHPITKGIDWVATFGGSSFRLEVPGQPLFVFGPSVHAYSDTQRDEPNPAPLEGHFQGAVLEFGKGRVAIFAEAAMFSAQLTGPNRLPMGMNAPIASQNAAFVLNLLHWLVGLL